MDNEKSASPMMNGVPFARTLGRIALGLCLGIALLPAVLELLAIAGSVGAFKYQGF